MLYYINLPALFHRHLQVQLRQDYPSVCRRGYLSFLPPLTLHLLLVQQTILQIQPMVHFVPMQPLDRFHRLHHSTQQRLQLEQQQHIHHQYYIVPVHFS